MASLYFPKNQQVEEKFKFDQKWNQRSQSCKALTAKGNQCLVVTQPFSCYKITKLLTWSAAIIIFTIISACLVNFYLITCLYCISVISKLELGFWIDS